MRWPFHIVFLGQGRPVWGYRLHNLTSKKESMQPQTASHAQESSISLKYVAVFLSWKGTHKPEILAVSSGRVCRDDRLHNPSRGDEYGHRLQTHTHTAHFPKWSHFDGCTHSEPHTTPPGTRFEKHPHLTEAELELVLCFVTGCLKSQCKRETNI